MSVKSTSRVSSSSSELPCPEESPPKIMRQSREFSRTPTVLWPTRGVAAQKNTGGQPQADASNYMEQALLLSRRDADCGTVDACTLQLRLS